MKKIINDPSNVVPEMLAGLVKAYPDYVTQLPDTTVLIRSDQASMQGKVGLVSGGGSGHEPSHTGFVGVGMLSAAVAGQVFTSPTPDQVYEAVKATDQGCGAFLIIKNYSGDMMTFEMAKDMAELDGISIDNIVVDDDIAVEDSLYTQGKRGVAGTLFMHKIIEAAAQTGASLAEISALAHEVLPHINTLAVALSAATVPEVGTPGFELAADEIEYGVGIHSKPGYRKEKLKPSKELVAELIAKLDECMHFDANKKYAVLINGMGATSLMEQFVFSNDVFLALAAKNITPVFSKVGNYMTSLEMAGISLTLFELVDDKWLEYLQAPIKFRNG